MSAVIGSACMPNKDCGAAGAVCGSDNICGVPIGTACPIAGASQNGGCSAPNVCFSGKCTDKKEMDNMMIIAGAVILFIILSSSSIIAFKKLA
jgi:hypothetical protein